MGESWPNAILSVLPSRKGAIAKPGETPADEDDETAVNNVEAPISEVPDDSVSNAVPVVVEGAEKLEQ